MKNKIRSRLLLYFSGSLIIFSLIIGIAFSFLFSRYNMDVHKDELERRATHMVGSIAGLLASDNEQGSGGTGHCAGQGAYRRLFDDMAMTDAWIVDHDMKQIARGRGQVALKYKDLPPGAEDVIEEAMAGSTTFSESFGSFLGEPSITVAAPITLSNGDIVGVVLLHEQIENIRSATHKGLIILLISIAAAVVVSFFVARSLAERFTKPLSEMQIAARKISEGDYSVKTGISQDDEIGELAESFDNMAMKLDAASKESVKLEKMRRDFVANISHELRTPVTVIRGSLEAFRDGIVSNPQMVEDYHRQMLSESIYLERLVSDLLDLARLQNKDFAMKMCEVDLKEIAGDAVRSIRRVAKDKNIEVRLSEGDKGFTVFGDYGRLRQLLLVLLDNAVKFSPEGGTVELALAAGRDAINLSVCDEGPGIAPEDIPYIFERFYKQRSEENKGGTGLGLAIAKQIADRHGAVLDARNRPEGGSEFILSMPLRASAADE